MITLSIILSIVWIVFTAQALYRRYHRCTKYKWTNKTLGLGDFHYHMPELTLFLIGFVICCVIVKFLP
jgi:hypothetical protein